MRLRYNLGGGKFVECSVDEQGLAEKYRHLDMNRMFVITDEDGKFKFAINPQLIVCVEAVE